MRLHTDTSDLKERLSGQEVAELRARLGIAEDQTYDRRAHGLSTVSDLAEAFSLPSGDVQAQLDRIRAERALAPKMGRKGSQVGLAALAVAMFATAWQIYKIRTPTFDEAVEKEIQDAVAQRYRHPKKITYPAIQSVDVGSLLPTGFTIRISGHYTFTEARGNGPNILGTYVEAADRLTRALELALPQEEELQRSTPKPPKPLQNDPIPAGAGRMDPARLRFEIGDCDEILDPRTDPSHPEIGPTLSIHEFCLREAEAVVQRTWDAQQQALGLKPSDTHKRLAYTPGFSNSPQTIQLPPGYSITSNDVQVLTSYQPLFFLIPVDETAVVRTLKAALTTVLRPGSGESPMSSELVGSKPAKARAFTSLEIDGPLRSLKYAFPTGPSPRFPTVADAWTGTNRLIEQAAREAGNQVREVNAGALPHLPRK